MGGVRERERANLREVYRPCLGSAGPRMVASKDLGTAKVIAEVARIEEYRGCWATRWDLYWAFPAFPEKVVMAKLSKLIRAGKINGCVCGCRGSFTIAS